MAESLILKQVDDRKDVKLFIVCLFVGFAGIVLLKMWWHADQVVVTLFPCAALVLYTVYVWRAKRYQLRGDRAGDSVYYLGFLYTLLSLGLSLYQFVMAGMGAREIVGNLGIALFTTIIGLAGRVVLTQLREDPVEIEESARMALAEAASQVRSELAQMVEDVNIFRRITMQSIVEGAEELSRETNKALLENVTAFTSSARAVIDRIEEVFADFGDNAKKLNKVSSGTVTALEKLINRVEAIEAPQGLISVKFDPLVERISEVITIFNAHTEEQRIAVDQLQILLEETTVKARHSMEGMTLLATSVSRVVDGIEKQEKIITADADAVRNMANMIKSLLAEIPEQQGAAFSKLTETTEAVRTLRESSSYLTEYAKNLTNASLRELINRLDKIGDAARKKMEAQADKLSDTDDGLATARSESEQSLPETSS
jgi:hypothetical protein